MPSLISTLLKSTIVQVALGLVAIIAVGSVTYYLIESRPPTLAFEAATTGTVTEEVTGTGVVSPIQNPTLTFTSGGRVTYVNAAVGQKVAAGTLLATMDTGVLGAQLASAQAQLNKLASGPRDVDVAGKNTAVSQAGQTASANLLALQNLIVSAAAQGEEAVYTKADPLFTGIGTQSQTGANPQLTVLKDSLGPQSTAQSTKVEAQTERGALTAEFTQWNTDTAGVDSTMSADDTAAAARVSIAHLQHVRQLLDNLVLVLSQASPNSTFPQTSITSALSQVNSARDTVNTLIANLTSGIQSVQSQNLAVQSAQDSLNQTLAGATPQDIAAARAQVAGIEAQIRELEIVAPFAGTIASVDIKAGDVLSPNTQAISLIPNGKSEVDLSLTEIEVAQLQLGDKADVTLDAYGATRTFAAAVSSIDHAPSTPNGSSTAGYKVTLIFTDADPSIAVGMHANATIHGATKDAVVSVPRTAIVQDGTQTYVLVKQGTTTVRTPVTVGLVGKNTVEITSGLTSGTQVATVGGN